MKTFLVSLTFGFFGYAAVAQDDLLSLVDDDSKEKKQFVTNAFKSTRIVNTHAAEHLSAGVLDVRILHRFGTFNGGLDNLYGFDQANMRLGFDYGLSNRVMIGVGRSNINRELDGFVKYRMIWQATGKGSLPFSLELVAGTTLNTMPYSDPSRVNFYSSRMAFYYQVLIARKFSENLTLQLTPSVVHINLVATPADQNDVYSIGFGGRYKISKRVSINWDYQYVLPGYLSTGNYNFAAVGFDIETGGHVFQLHITNGMGMNERAFITSTTDQINNMGLRLGFNLSRVFTVSHKNRTVVPR
jgi:predicted porin